ncbi:hypothetical protein N7457_001577 [Penicillium paradoxum]|uniref:uncharacterized protein n=1 Tax=Penicillium paradoxum TaxID=176176 RepID=UPI002546AEDC|nr:uncharacterized protein N7457_001577 [Penicillium paradoxum]KAJ5794978.1 hypothetical protein N7457_001577 [Penicillium paradoxum]
MHLKWITGLLFLGIAQADNDKSALAHQKASQHQTAADPYSHNQAPPRGEKLSRRKWTVTCDTSQEGNECERILDDDLNSFWLSEDESTTHEVIVDLSSVENVHAISVVPRQDGNADGQIVTHQVFVSEDKENWGEPVAFGTWYEGDGEKLAIFEPKQGQYVRLVSLGTNLASISALQIYDIDDPQQIADGGVWGPTIDLPIVAVSGAVIPGTGEVLVWSSWAKDDYLNSQLGVTLTAIWNPANGSVTQTKIQHTHHDMFCSGMSYDGKGELLVTGGNNDQLSSLFDPASDTWTEGPLMALPRGYQASATISDGRVFIIGGSWNGGTNEDKNGEIYDLENDEFSRLPGALVKPMWTEDRAAGYRRDSHGWIFGWKNGTVFQAGPSKNMNWYYTDDKGDQQPAGTRADADDSMSGNAVMFDSVNGKIITFGGSPSYDHSYATNAAYLIEINEPGSEPKVSVAKNPSGDGMAYARTYHTSVVLPDGGVFTTGGQTYGVPFNDSNAQMTPELYDPEANEFREQQPNSIVRVYHSISLLLPDGRVFNGGGGLGASSPTNHFDAQVYTPQYLLNDDGTLATRPSIDSVAKSSLRAGDKISISTSTQFSRASLIRYGSTTHTVNTDQRRVALDSWTANGDFYEATLPEDTGALIPGPWMLFILNEAGVPSVAETIHIEI